MQNSNRARGRGLARDRDGPSTTNAQTRSNRTVLTFSQPIEVPGRILPAGTYVFQLADSLSDRHIVQISNADGSQLITTILAISNSRLTATDKTVITFNEVARGAPEAIRAWFYPAPPESGSAATAW